MRRLVSLAALTVPVAAVAMTTGLVATGGSVAHAGGGCHEPITDQATQVVKLVHACFSPSVARVKPGVVEFRSVSDIAHEIVFLGGTTAPVSLSGLQSARVRFDRAGAFPFSCPIHPGMAGVLLVGDVAAPAGGSTGPAEVLPSLPAATPPAAAVQLRADDSASTIGTPVAGVGGLAAGALIGSSAVLLRRKRLS